MNFSPALFGNMLAKMFPASRYAERLCAATPTLLEELRAYGHEPFPTSIMYAACAGDHDEAGLHRTLRLLRKRVLLRTIFRDLNNLATLDEVVATVTALAEISIQQALTWHSTMMQSTYGVPRGEESGQAQTLLVAGMGKLGGGELNVSSDIDLVFLYAEEGQTDGVKTISNHEYFARLGRKLIAALDTLTEDGFVFRVDMRLRPFGDSGPLVCSFAALENYFITQARPWERYAWLKARAITGEAQNIQAFEVLVRPFVYRRYHDYAAIDEMRDLHAQIRTEAGKRDRLDDIKIGIGGIREIEFIAQLFQLIRGGREASLQIRSTRQALTQLEKLKILDTERIASLQSAYAFLRNLEHRLQYLDDQQTQMLPASDTDRQRIAAAMNEADWPAFLATLSVHRHSVTREFEALFVVQEQATSVAAASAGLSARCHTITRQAGMAEEPTTQIVSRVQAWLTASRTQTLPAKSRARMEILIPLALSAALAEDTAPQTFFRLFNLIEAVDKRETYLALLIEYPQVLARVAHIVACSAWAAEFLCRHPILMDELIETHRDKKFGNSLDWKTERNALRTTCDAAAGDIERQYEILRHTKNALTLRLNIADIEGHLGVMALSDELSALADLLLDTALVLAWRALGPQPGGVDWQPPAGFAIIGYGKLGSKELGYASDLDLVFLCDEQSGIDTVRYAKLAQRLNNWLNAMTAGGVLYETDIRLRPDGEAGLPVSTLSAFRDYQLNRAWTWEHQALTRARFCAGDPALAAPFEAIRREILSRPRERAALKQEISAMRDKMRAEKKDRAGQLDLKHTRGGIVDVEFIVQYLILAYSHEHPEFLGNLGNFALLTRAAALGILEENLAARIAKAYLAYRERQHRARTNNELKTWIEPTELSAERHAVMQAWADLFGET